MVIAGKACLLFDIRYVFEKKAGVRYVELPDDLTPAEECAQLSGIAMANRGAALVCTQDERAIGDCLAHDGLVAGRDYALFSQLARTFVEQQTRSGCPVEEAYALWEMFRRIFFAPHGRFSPCHHPLYEAELAENGEVFTCCSAIMPIPIGSLRDSSLLAAWHSMRAKLVRLSLLNGTGVFCSTERCKNLRPAEGASPAQRARLSDAPLVLNVAVDATCNLACPSCRRDRFVASSAQSAEKRAWLGGLERSVYEHLEDLYVAGNGECLYSPVYREYLLGGVPQCFRGRLHLLTNGQIWDGELIDALSKRFHPEVMLSIDAWSPERYVRLRWGASYERMRGNLDRYIRLARTGLLQAVAVRFVIQTGNYREIPAFIDGMRAQGIDRMEFTRLVDGGSFEPEGFRSSSLLDRDGGLQEAYHAFFKTQVLPRLGADTVMDAAYLRY